MNTEIPVYQVDAFTDRPFTGNPAGVCLLDEARDNAWLQAMAAELNLSASAFLQRRTDGDWWLRWFTPACEVNLCGHATLAAAHVLWHERGEPGKVLVFHTRSGILTALREGNTLRLAFPARPPTPIALTSPLHTALGIALGRQPQYLGRGGEDLVVVLPTAADVRDITLDPSRLAWFDTRGMIVTAPGDQADHDFVSRFFAPRTCIAEDPVTGSAHCVLGPYWGSRLGKHDLRGRQISERGGVVDVRLTTDGVELSGHAITVLRWALSA